MCFLRSSENNPPRTPTDCNDNEKQKNNCSSRGISRIPGSSSSYYVDEDKKKTSKAIFQAHSFQKETFHVPKLLLCDSSIFVNYSHLPGFLQILSSVTMTSTSELLLGRYVKVVGV